MSERLTLLSASVLLVPALLLAARDRPSFVVILSDDQSWVGSSVLMDPADPRTRSDYFRTPSLERLAESGIRFTDGYAPASTCCPTRRAIQTGLTPARHLYRTDRQAWQSEFRRQLNIPGMLKRLDAGYVAAHYGKWDYRHDRPTPEEMGYDESDGYTGNGTGRGRGTGGPAAAEDPKLIGHVTDRACEFLAKAGDPRLPRNHPLRGAKGSVYEGGIRVPFFAAGPGVARGRTIRTPVTGLDILPTIADLSGFGAANLPSAVDGGSLAPLLRGQATTVERRDDFLIFHQAIDRETQSALRLGRWKLVKTWASDLLELFDLVADPGEVRNLASESPERTAQLHALMREFLSDVGAETRETGD